MSEISTIYQPQQQASSSTVTTPTPPSTASSTSSTRDGGDQTPDTANFHRHSSHARRPRTHPHENNNASRDGVGFQIRQGSFKLNSLRLPSTVARFVVLQVIFSIGCAVLGILAVAFRCWMAYLCVPVVVGAVELLVGILGYTAIKRPRKKALVKCYFIGCLVGSVFGLGLVAFSIFAAATEENYTCYLLPHVAAQCTVVRGARFAIELTTVMIGIFEIVITQVMFLIMCYGSCSRIRTEDNRTRSRARAPHLNLADDIPANLELPPYDEHHIYPTSYPDSSYFTNSTHSEGYDPPSYTNIGLVNDEVPSSIIPYAAGLGPTNIPAEPPPPYTLFASGMRSTPIGGTNRSAGDSGLGSSGTAVSNVGIIQTLAEPAGRDAVVRGDNIRASGRSMPGQRGVYDPLLAWRDRAIHQSLRMNLEDSMSAWGLRPVPQQQQGALSEEDPTILPPEMYRDEIRRSGHRYSLSDPILQSRNARNRQRSRSGQPAGQANNEERTRNNTNLQEMEVEVSVHRTREASERDSSRRRPPLPPPYEGPHNIIRTDSTTNSPTRQNRSSVNSNSHTYDTCGTGNPESTNERPSSPSESRQGRGMQRSRTLSSDLRSGQPSQEAIYESIPSPDYSPVREPRSPSENQNTVNSVEQNLDQTLDQDLDDEQLTLISEADSVISSGHSELVDGSEIGSDITGSWGFDQINDENSWIRSSGRSWDISIVQDRGRCPDSSREYYLGSTHQESARDSPSENPPPYRVRRMPSYSPPPYRRNQSLPNFSRRLNLTSLPPPYHGSQQQSGNRFRGRSLCSDNRRRVPGHAIQEMTELSNRFVNGQINHERNVIRNPVTCVDSIESCVPRTGINSGSGIDEMNERSTPGTSIPRPIVSSTLPRVSVSSMAVDLPPSAFRRVTAPPRSGVIVSSAAPFETGVTVTPVARTIDSVRNVSCSSSHALPDRAVQEQSRISSSRELEQARIMPSRTCHGSNHDQTSTPSPSSVLSNRDSRTTSPRRTNPPQNNRDQTRPVPAVRLSTQSAQHPQPIHPRSSTLPSQTNSSTSANTNNDSSQRTVPLHPLSLPDRTAPTGPSTENRNGRSSAKPEVMPRGKLEVKPSAQIHPFRTVKSTPVKPQRVFVATKALANALQKGHLNDLLDEYEETII